MMGALNKYVANVSVEYTERLASWIAASPESSMLDY
jgi:hypothetical protein